MATDIHDRRLRRGRRWWDLVSPVHSSAGGSSTQATVLALRYLDLRKGHSVLDLGCGSGAALPTLSAAVGPSGRVVGIDYSPRMLARADAVLRERGIQNVELRRADATRVALEPASFDAAYACASISAMPDIPAALTTVRRALRPGGRLFVFDMRLVPRGWSTPLIWLIQGIYRVSAGWTGVDVLDSARDIFAEVTLPDLPGKEGVGQPSAGWPPYTVFVATVSP
ncbi:class I SAM-dependent methyltransferase [Pseudonocardia acaciae]|uniref:class I SAM-dependent methyltransferase n=1 Tax=Pseudonocardia acaciae TaxID=551276 RepID=UPI000686CA32|nr:methyltransferase domain-containing protein [Pseudonocardia acaciae]